MTAILFSDTKRGLMPEYNIYALLFHKFVVELLNVRATFTEKTKLDLLILLFVDELLNVFFRGKCRK